MFRGNWLILEKSLIKKNIDDFLKLETLKKEADLIRLLLYIEETAS
jgi:hypothetical protein